jgi:hypothetical protein
MKHIISMLSLLLLSIVSFAQDNTKAIDRQSFVGTWIFDEKASDAHPHLEELYNGQILKITVKESEFKIVETQIMNIPKIMINGVLVKKGEKRSATIIFYTDNRGEVNKPYPFNQNAEVTSKTEWNKNILVRNYKTDIYRSGKLEGDIKSTETYSVSKDGKALTVTTKTRTTFANNESGKTKLVYNRTG